MERDHQRRHDEKVRVDLHFSNPLVVVVEGLLEVLLELRNLKEQNMADAQSILAEVSGIKDIVKAISAGVDGLNGSYTSIEEAIDDLKTQIGGGQPPDFAPLEAEVADLKRLVTDLKPAILKGTAVDPSNMGGEAR